MGDRDDLAAIIADDDNFDHDPDADAWFINKLRAADAVLAAGWTRLKTVTTVEELKELAEETVLLGDNEIIFERRTVGWISSAYQFPLRVDAVPLPAIVLFQPVP